MNEQTNLTIRVENSDELKKLAKEVHEHLHQAVEKLNELDQFELQFSVEQSSEENEKDYSSE